MAKEVKKQTIEFLNPFLPGITYDKFIESIPEKTSVKDHLKQNIESITEDELNWIDAEINNYKNK